jgi:hypothetical protein
MVAEGYGATGVRVEMDDDLEPALRAALASRRPTVLHLIIDRRWVSVDRLDDAAPKPEPEPEPEPEPMVADEASEPGRAPDLAGEAAPEVDAAPGTDAAPEDGAVPET